MPRKPRFFLPNVPIHLIVRGNNRKVVFGDDPDRQAYLGWLKEATLKHDCQLHAYVLMDNHIHLLLSASDTNSLSRLPQYVGRKYVPYFNHKYGRTGTLWEGRFKASLIDSDQYLLTCMRYIELNPVRAQMVKHPREYRWSSHRGNAYQQTDSLLTPHALYKKLARTESERKKRYRQLFKHSIDASVLQSIRNCTQTGTPLGSHRFKEQIEKLLKTKVGYSKRGRPGKSVESE